jgi:hypothetical protein
VAALFSVPDYGDVVREWDDPRRIGGIIESTVEQVIERMQSGPFC